MKTADSRLTILQLVPEPLPTYRPDLCDLFGHFLPALGITCRIVGHAQPAGTPETASWASQDRACANWPHAPRLVREAAYLLLALRRLASAAREDVDVIQVRDMVSIGLLGWLAARLLGRKFVWWMSFPMSEDRIARAELMHARSRLRAMLLRAKGRVEAALLYRFLLPRADHVFVQSEAMQAMLHERGIPNALMTPVPMCVDCSRLAPQGLAARRPPDWEAHPLMVYLGTLDAGREPGTLLRALAVLRSQCPAARLLLIGDASTDADRQALQDLIDGLGQEDAVRVTGWLPRTEALQYLLGADVCISWYPRSPVLDVGTPTKLVECLALGVPVIANDHPDQRAIIRASQAGLICATSAESLTEALRTVLSRPDEAAERALRGPAWVARERNYERMASALSGRYRMLFSGDGLATAQTKSNR